MSANKYPLPADHDDLLIDVVLVILTAIGFAFLFAAFI